jgi:hypothetical protein
MRNWYKISEETSFIDIERELAADPPFSIKQKNIMSQ